MQPKCLCLGPGVYAHSELRASFISGAILPAVFHMCHAHCTGQKSMISVKCKLNFNCESALKALKLISEAIQFICQISEAKSKLKAESLDGP